MKIISAALFFIVLAVSSFALFAKIHSVSALHHYPEHVEAALRSWNGVRDKYNRDNNLPYKTSQDYTDRSDLLLRAFAAEVPEGPELDAVMKKYNHVKPDIHDRIFNKESKNFYVPLTNAPQQIHLSVTAQQGNVTVMWLTAASSSGSQVCYRPANSAGASSCNTGTFWTYNPISDLAWTGNVHIAHMDQGLVAGNLWEYTVGDPSINVTSEVFQFKVPQLEKDELFVYFGGDMGTVQLCGYKVAEQMFTDLTTRDAANPPDAFWLIGDIAYSTLDPPHNSFEFFWDWFGQQEQGLASRIPMQVSAGNHDASAGDWAAFINRYRMPQNQIHGHGNYYWAYSHGPVKYISMCTEPGLSDICNYTEGSPQYRWIEAQLATVDRSRTPWVILAGHRPFLSSDKSTDSGALPYVIGPLLQKYRVDVNLAGHMHEHELAIWPVVNGTKANLTGVVKVGENAWHVQNPFDTIAITAGALGAVINEKWITPQPEWSLARGGTLWDGEYNYGYATMKATKNSLEFSFRAQKTNTTLWSVIITK